MDHECNGKKIPTFGNWDYANDLPITKYFESARQAGLLRYTAPSVRPRRHHSGNQTHRTTTHVQTKGREKRSHCPHVKEQAKVLDVTEPPTKHTNHSHGAVSPRRRHRVVLPSKPPKPADEDLYKIPPELLHSTQRKKKLGIFSRCLVPCTA